MENQLKVDAEILKFLIGTCFGKYDDKYKMAANRAYLDMNRTLHFHKMENLDRAELRNDVVLLLENKIKAFIRNKASCTQEDFDLWHFNISDEIRNIYQKKNISFTYGQAQKWINMMFKYLYILSEEGVLKILKNLHVPLDRYIINAAYKEFGIMQPNCAWSKWDDYESQYLAYQKELRRHISLEEPLKWEIKQWNKVVFPT